LLAGSSALPDIAPNVPNTTAAAAAADDDAFIPVRNEAIYVIASADLTTTVQDSCCSLQAVIGWQEPNDQHAWQTLHLLSLLLLLLVLAIPSQALTQHPDLHNTGDQCHLRLPASLPVHLPATSKGRCCQQLLCNIHKQCYAAASCTASVTLPV
jgi:hypothetical protein